MSLQANPIFYPNCHFLYIVTSFAVFAVCPPLGKPPPGGKTQFVPLRENHPRWGKPGLTPFGLCTPSRGKTHPRIANVVSTGVMFEMRGARAEYIPDASYGDG
jgi:hypothetical protein